MSRDLRITATRLRHYLMCRRLPYMDAYGAKDRKVEPPILRWLQNLGVAHEEKLAADEGRAVLAESLGDQHERRSAKDVLLEHVLDAPRKSLRVSVPSGRTPKEVAADTERLMAAGRAGVYNGLLISDEWRGSPDWLVRAPGRSRWGRWHYFPVDAKATGKMPRAVHILPTVFYALQLERIQGVLPSTVIIRGRDRPTRIETGPHVDETRRTIARVDQILRGAEDPQPDLGSKCERCSWRQACLEDAHRSGDLSLLPDTSRRVKEALIENGLRNIPELAAADSSELQRDRVLRPHAARLIDQARSLADGRARVIRPELLPPRRAVEIFIDFEGIPGPFGQLIVVYGILILRPRRPEFISFVARDDTHQEVHAALKAFLLEIDEVPRDAPIFHWGNYEKAALRRNRMAETDALAERTLDLHQIVRNSAVVPTRSRQLKELAAGLGIQKTSDLESGLQAPAIWRRWVERRERHALDALHAYNRSDLRLAAEVLAKIRGALPR